MSNNLLIQIADRVLNQPLLIYPPKLAAISEFLEGRIAIDASDLKPLAEEIISYEASRFIGDFAPDPTRPGARKPYRTTAEGVAIIPVVGSLVNRGGFFSAMSGVASYESIKMQVARAAGDDDVKSILLDIDSPGGEATGAFEAGDAVRLASAEKTVIAVANGLCCSAAYAIASGATKLITSRSSVVGSIGVALLHLDRSKQLSDMGIKPTLITTGARKGDGSPYFELTDEVKAALREHVLEINELFVGTVAGHRANLSAETILNFKAGVFLGEKAVSAGLADEVGTFESALSGLSSGGSGRRSQRVRVAAMTDTVTKADHDAAVSQARADGVATGSADATKAANDRLVAVTSHELFAGRSASAIKLLATTSMTAEQITGVLADLPKTETTAAAPAPAPAAAAPPAGRSKESPTGLAAVDTGAGAEKDPVATTDYDKGAEIAALSGFGKKKTAA